MSDDQNMKLVLDQLTKLNDKHDQTQKSVNDLTTEFKLHQQESQHRWEAIEKLDNEQNQILAEHRSTGLAQQEANKIARQELEMKMSNRIEKVEKRVDKTEQPQKFWHMVGKIAAYIGTIGSAIYVVGKIAGKW